MKKLIMSADVKSGTQIKRGGTPAFFAENREKILAFGEYFLEKLSDRELLYCKGYMKYTTTITHAIALFATLSAILRKRVAEFRAGTSAPQKGRAHGKHDLLAMGNAVGGMSERIHRVGYAPRCSVG